MFDKKDIDNLGLAHFGKMYAENFAAFDSNRKMISENCRAGHIKRKQAPTGFYSLKHRFSQAEIEQPTLPMSAENLEDALVSPCLKLLADVAEENPEAYCVVKRRNVVRTD